MKKKISERDLSPLRNERTQMKEYALLATKRSESL